MRHLFALFLAFAFVLPDAATAQDQRYSILGRGCVDPGGVVTLAGPNLGREARGSIVLLDGHRALGMRIATWSDRRITARVPSERVEAGKRYDVAWQVDRRNAATFGTVEICRGKFRHVSPGLRAGADEVPAPDGTPEYMVSVTTAQANAASAALQAQGAQLLRTRALPSLGRVLLFVALPGNLTSAEAQEILDAAANGAQIDLHNIYGFAAGPRLYAAAAIGDGSGVVCRLGAPVAVGIIDGPVDPAHPALRGGAVTRASFVDSGDRSPSPEHGTAVAALIAGTGSGEITGFAPGARIFAASAFTVRRGSTGAELEHVAASLDWLAAQRVRLVNMSFSGRANAAFRDIIAAASRQGMVMVAATGNTGKRAAEYPAAAPEVIAVTAVDAVGNLYSKATRGDHVEFAAPGVQVWTVKGSGGGYQTGTSFAAPIVTALVARRAASGVVNADAARESLRRGARDLGPTGRDADFGWGLVQSGGCD